MSEIQTSMEFRHSITVWLVQISDGAWNLNKILVFRNMFFFNCVLNPKFFVRISVILCDVWNLDPFCLDYRHFMCLKTEHTKVQISDKLGFQVFTVCWLCFFLNNNRSLYFAVCCMNQIPPNQTIILQPNFFFNNAKIFNNFMSDFDCALQDAMKH